MSWTFDALLPTFDANAGFATMDGWSPSSGTPAAPSVFTWSPSYGVPKKTSFELRKASFGDGYQQRSALGMNNIKRQWDLMWKGKTEDVALDIQDFFEARKDGISFLWTPPFMNRNAEEIKVICVAFDVTPASYNNFDVVAVFEQVYGE